MCPADRYGEGVYRGVVIEESLDDRSPLVLLRATGSNRFDIAEPGEGQPPVWTVTDFEVDDAAAPGLAAALSGALKPGPWYVDFNDGHRSYVVFAGRVFSYERGDAAAVELARQHAASVGVPASQIDWAVPD